MKELVKKIPFAVSYYEGTVIPRKKMREFKKDFSQFSKLSYEKGARFSLNWKDRFPCLDDKTASTRFEPHYTYHPAWAARILSKTKPEYHVDISSTLQFSAIISAFIPVRFYDFRPANLKLSNLSSKTENLAALSFVDNSIISLSCMHVVEHVGLGRYGDPLDPDGDKKAIRELKRVLAKGGDLIFVTPVGRPRIQFNAHRIYSYDQILDLFSDLELQEYSLIPDNAVKEGMIMNATRQQTEQQDWGCGCFWFKKK